MTASIFEELWLQLDTFNRTAILLSDDVKRSAVFYFFILVLLTCCDTCVVFAFTLDCNNNLYSCCANDAKLLGAVLLLKTIVETQQKIKNICSRTLCCVVFLRTAGMSREIKLTWLVLGGDPAARSHRVEQFTAL